MKYPVIILLLVLSVSCNSKKPAEEPKPVVPAPKEAIEPLAGEPCSYKDNIYPARVLKVEGADANSLDISFEVTRGKEKDTITYSDEMHRYMTQSEIEQNGIVLDAQYKYVESDIVSGSCTPHIKRLLLQKYEGKK